MTNVTRIVMKFIMFILGGSIFVCIMMIIILGFQLMSPAPHCARCGSTMTATQNYCNQCGEKVMGNNPEKDGEPLIYYCSKCGVELANEQKFCKICGQKQASN